MLYANDISKTCVTSCIDGYHLYDANQSCIPTCPVLLEPISNQCVDICPRDTSTNTMLYANLVSNTCVSAANCPISTYASDALLKCVSECPQNTFIYLTNCVTYCPSSYYKNLINSTCVIPNNCPSGQYADNISLTCISQCNGNFADNSTKSCVDVCPGTTYGDPFTGYC